MRLSNKGKIVSVLRLWHWLDSILFENVILENYKAECIVETAALLAFFGVVLSDISQWSVIWFVPPILVALYFLFLFRGRRYTEATIGMHLVA